MSIGDFLRRKHILHTWGPPSETQEREPIPSVDGTDWEGAYYEWQVTKTWTKCQVCGKARMVSQASVKALIHDWYAHDQIEGNDQQKR